MRGVSQQVAIVQGLIGDVPEKDNETLIETYLAKAKEAILRQMHPFGFDEEAEVPYQYAMLQCELASRYILRRGAEGETSHNENGINRTYKSVDDSDLLSQVMQIVGGM